MHDPVSNPPSSSSTAASSSTAVSSSTVASSSTAASAPLAQKRPSWGQSPYENLTAQQVADQHVAWIKKRRLIFIPTEIALFAAAICVIALKPPAAGVIYLALLAAAVAISLLHRARATARFSSLHQICSHECDPAKYRTVMEILVAADVHDRSRNILATEQARGLYYQNEPMRALQLLSQVSFKSPKNPYWLAVLSIEAMCRHAVGDSAGESLALSRLEELGRKAATGSNLAQELDKLKARYQVIFKDPAAWTPQDAAFIRDGIGRAQSPLEYASWLLDECTWEQLHGDRTRARQIIAFLDEMRLTPLHKKRRDALASALGLNTETESQPSL